MFTDTKGKCTFSALNTQTQTHNDNAGDKESSTECSFTCFSLYADIKIRALNHNAIYSQICTIGTVFVIVKDPSIFRLSFMFSFVSDSGYR